MEWQKGENVYAMGEEDKAGINLRGSARYISHDSGPHELPLLLSDKGYGILPASDHPAYCCDIPAYGTYLCMEESRIDYYFIAGKRQNTILNGYAYLCGKLQ